MSAMRAIGRVLARFSRDEDGATAIEYALIAVGISVAIAASVRSVGSNLNTNYFQKILAAVSG